MTAADRPLWAIHVGDRLWPALRIRERPLLSIANTTSTVTAPPFDSPSRTPQTTPAVARAHRPGTPLRPAARLSRALPRTTAPQSTSSNPNPRRDSPPPRSHQQDSSQSPPRADPPRAPRPRPNPGQSSPVVGQTRPQSSKTRAPNQPAGLRPVAGVPATALRSMPVEVRLPDRHIQWHAILRRPHLRDRRHRCRTELDQQPRRDRPRSLRLRAPGARGCKRRARPVSCAARAPRQARRRARAGCRDRAPRNRPACPARGCP